MLDIPIVAAEEWPHADPRPMELIIKPTEACNFKCTFCSSSDISDDHSMVLDLNRVFSFLHRFPNTGTIIVNGGDPLMVKPEFYWKLIDFLDRFGYEASISFTTNLWAFYKKPEKWVELFNHPRLGITTSFQYGGGRLKGDGSEFTEQDFWEVSDMMLELVGYRPDFISVISDENEDTAIDNVKLAKKMGVECKLNYAMASGDQSAPYQLSKIYDIYVMIYVMRLSEWEYNTKQMMTRLSHGNTTCPQARNCDTNIRALNPEGDYYSCGAFGDDRDKPIDFNTEVFGAHVFEPLQHDIHLFALKSDCVGCPMFDICNGCRKTIKDLKAHGMVESHCELMKAVAPDILKINFLEQPEEFARRMEML